MRDRNGRLVWVWKTSRASPYPVALVRHAAEILEKIASRIAFVTPGEEAISSVSFAEISSAYLAGCSKSDRGRAELAAANGEWPTAAPPLAPLPAKEPRPWPVGAETWGRR